MKKGRLRGVIKGWLWGCVAVFFFYLAAYLKAPDEVQIGWFDVIAWPIACFLIVLTIEFVLGDKIEKWRTQKRHQ